MKQNMSFVHIALVCLLLSSSVLLSVSVWAQAPQIAFSSWRDWNEEIYVMDADGKNQRNLTNNPAWDNRSSWFDPAFASKAVFPAGKLGTTWGKIKHELY